MTDLLAELADAQAVIDELRLKYTYDKAAGVFIRTATRGAYKVGDIAGHINGKGYRCLTVCGREYRVHRLVFLIETGAWPINEIDHLNGVRDDNRFDNLRDVTRSVNMQNMRKAPAQNKSSRLIGASWSKRYRRWYSCIIVSGRKCRLGFYASEQDAHAGYLAAKRALHAGNTL